MPRLRDAGARSTGPRSSGKSLLEIRAQPVGSDPILFERVAVAHGHRAVLRRIAVHGNAEGGSHLVLPPVPLADAPRLVVVDGKVPPQLVRDPVRHLRLALLLSEREYRRLDRRERRMQTEHDAPLVL